MGPGPFAAGPGGKPNDNTKPQKTIQSPDRLYKAQKKIIQSPKTLYKDIKSIQRQKKHKDLK